MTPEDLIADLRDIHEPAREAAAGAGLSLAPLAIFALCLAAGWVWSRRRAGRWRREAAARLSAARRIKEPEARWAALVALFQQVSRAAGVSQPPDYLFQPRMGAGAEDRAEDLAAEIARRIG